MNDAFAARTCRATAGGVEHSFPEIHRPSGASQGEPLGVYPFTLEITCTGTMSAGAASESLQLVLFYSAITQEADYLVNGARVGVGYQLYDRQRGILINSISPRYWPLESRPATSATVVYQIPLDIALFGTSQPLVAGHHRLSGSFRTRIYFPKATGGGTAQQDVEQDHAMVIPIRTVTCNLSALPWRLDPVGAEELSTPGASAGRKAFGIAMDCDGAASLSMTLTDAENAVNTTTVLTPDAASTTMAIGLEVLRGGAPIRLGTPWVHSAAAGTSTMDMEAHYVRTTGALQPGDISSKATLTLTYR